MGNASSSSKQVQPVPKSSSPEKIQLEFEPSFPHTEPVSMSNDPTALSGLPQEILLKVVDLTDVKLLRNLLITCKFMRNFLQPWFLPALASAKYLDRATSGFITDVIGDNNNTCLWSTANFSLEGRPIPKGLFIHLFTNTTAKKISSIEVCSMIIQFSDSSESSKLHPDICSFCKLLFSKVSFTNLKCLMFYGLQLSYEFSQCIGALKLKVFHVAEFGTHINFSWERTLRPCNTLEKVYVMHPDENVTLYPPEKLKKLVIYCPESRGGVIKDTEARRKQLTIVPVKTHAIEEM
jgi:hypothetical protein